MSGHKKRTAKFEEFEEKQRRFIAEIRSHLTVEENAQVTDKLIWQRAAKFGPNTPKGHAEGIRAALAAFAPDQYGDDLAAELGIQP